MVDDEHVQHFVVPIHVDIGLGIDRIRETSQLGYLETKYFNE